MSTVLTSIACIALEAQTASSGVGTAGNPQQQVLDLTREWIKAEEQGNRDVLARIVADDFVGTGPRGNRITKDMVVPAEGSGQGGFVKEGRDIEALVYGTTAIVRGVGIPGRTDRPQMRFTLVFVQRDAKWQMVGGHISIMPPSEQ